MTVTVNPASVSGGLLSTAQGDELQFNLVFDAVRADQVGIDLGSNVQNAGLKLDPSTRATLNSDLHFDFTFGVDLTPGLNAAEAFFVRVNALTLGETIHETNMNTPAKVGLLGGQVQGGTLDLAGAVSVTLVNPDADAKGNITLAELQNTNISAGRRFDHGQFAQRIAADSGHVRLDHVRRVADRNDRVDERLLRFPAGHYRKCGL